MRDIVAGHVEKRYIQLGSGYRYHEIKRLHTRSVACRLNRGGNRAGQRGVRSSTSAVNSFHEAI